MTLYHFIILMTIDFSEEHQQVLLTITFPARVMGNDHCCLGIIRPFIIKQQWLLIRNFKFSTAIQFE